MFLLVSWQTKGLPFISSQRCCVKKGALKILRNSQENICVRVLFLIKLFQKLFQNTTSTQVFSCAFKKYLRRSFFIEHLMWLLLTLLQFFSEVKSSHSEYNFNLVFTEISLSQSKNYKPTVYEASPIFLKIQIFDL